MHSATVRIDKWLWAARFFKTRSLATDAVDNGKVRLNGARTKPAHSVKPGDVLVISNGAADWEVGVLALAEVRGSADMARTLYAETDASSARRTNDAEQRKLYREPGTTIKGRPTKRDRRALERSSS
ncbi:Ribosome-associated heat shock protein implicated in the recycling of the 50S subunit [Oxalobacteraceae bacterium IMCC9480]|nr:Ribosome-associated heat shock protein implicated in the recycling of the 50S subunit [Oxalobacteraceae bacterium IMCC9480]NDP59919.1 RNA-binding S4 domain-containing protein [Oxalobacteraceae bacterium]